ncbi:MAG: LysR family transcriptional regulator [Burkholderiales bacterium]|nr:LysR family transcriptional regulator [Burkholderiales bacterium]
MSRPTARVAQLRLRDLMLLDLIDTHRSLRRVAEELHLTQPAVTQALQGLEQAFGVRLVERERRGVRLAPAGRAALTHLRAAGREVKAALALAAAPQRVQLRLGCSPMSALKAVPLALARLRAAMPDVQVLLCELSVPDLWSQLHEGRLDAIVSRTHAPDAGLASHEGLRIEWVDSETLVLVASRKHPLARRRPKAEQLQAHRWVLPPRGSLARRMIDDWFTQAQQPLPEVCIESTSFVTNLRLAASCGLLTLAPQSVVASEGQALGLAVVPAPWDERRGDIVLATRASREDDPLIQALREAFAYQAARPAPAPAQTPRKAPREAALMAR